MWANVTVLLPAGRMLAVRAESIIGHEALPVLIAATMEAAADSLRSADLDMSTLDKGGGQIHVRWSCEGRP